MNGTATVTATEDHQHQHQQAQNEPTSEHPRSPASPLSVRHGEITQQNVFKILATHTAQTLQLYSCNVCAVWVINKEIN